MTKLTFTFLIAFVLPGLIFGQDTVKTFHANGQLKDLEIYLNGKSSSGYHYSNEGVLEYHWDTGKKLLESFTNITYHDTLANKFKRICPTYTIMQHFGNGPLYQIENYKNNVRDGLFEEYDRNGRLIAKGQFSDWKKVGIWAYYDAYGNVEKTFLINGAYDSRGVSIPRTIIPTVLTILLLVFLGNFMTRRLSYYTFYVSVSIFTIILFLSLFTAGNILTKYPDNTFTQFIRNYSIATLSTFLFAMTVLSIVNLFFTRRFKTNFILNLILALTGIVMGLFIAASYAVSGIRIIG